MTIAKLANVIGVFGNQLPSPNQLASRCIVVQVTDEGSFHIKSVENGSYRALTPGEVPVLTGIQISGDGTIDLGQTKKLSVMPHPEHISIGAVVWSCDQPNLATIDAHTGELKGLVEGIVEITAEVGGLSSVRTYVVKKPDLTGLTLEPATVGEGGTVTLTVKPIPSSAEVGAITYLSKNPSILNNTDVSTGEFIGVLAGSTTVTAQSPDGIIATTTVTVTPPALTGLTVSAKSVVAGKTITMTASPVPTHASKGTITWTSDTEAVATVNSKTGVVTGHKAGTANITATSNGKTGTAIVTVTAPALTHLTVPTTTLEVGAHKTMQATPVPTGASAGTVKWTSATPSVLSIEATTGVTTGLKAGTSVVTATSGSKTGHATVTVTAKPAVVAKKVETKTTPKVEPKVTTTDKTPAKK